MKKSKTQAEVERKATGFRLNVSLVQAIKMEAIKRGCQPNELVEEGIRLVLKQNKIK